MQTPRRPTPGRSRKALSANHAGPGTRGLYRVFPYSAPCKWSYIFTDAEELLRPFFDPAALPNSRLLAQVLHGWSGIFSSADHPALANYVKMILQEMQTRSLNYEISVRGLFVALITEVMRLSTEQMILPQQTAWSLHLH